MDPSLAITTPQAVLLGAFPAVPVVEVDPAVSYGIGSDSAVDGGSGGGGAPLPTGNPLAFPQPRALASVALLGGAGNDGVGGGPAGLGPLTVPFSPFGSPEVVVGVGGSCTPGVGVGGGGGGGSGVVGSGVGQPILGGPVLPVTGYFDPASLLASEVAMGMPRVVGSSEA
jgi:hypothetical protein